MSTVLFSVFPLLLCVRIFKADYVVSLLKELWPIAVPLAGADGLIVVSLEVSKTMDEVFSIAAVAMAGAGFAAWARRYN